jgi:lysophospholipase L1-like esterase
MGNFIKMLSIGIFLLCSAGLRAEDGGEIRYVPIGDSYSAGTGASPQEAWPVLLMEHLRQDGVNIQLIDNPARNGWTAYDAIMGEMPAFKQSKPNFATLMIGTNDWVHGLSPETFRAHLIKLMDTMLEQLGNKRLLVVNLPDFSVTPVGKSYADGRDTKEGLKEFNRIVSEESEKRGLSVVDIFTVSQKIGEDMSLVAEDGMHPSAKGYRLYEAAIYSKAKELLLR